MNIINLFSNFFGLINGKLFGEPPLYVDKEKLPGMTPIPKPTLSNWIIKAPFVLITTPNFVWASISLLTYFYFPYNLSSNSISSQGPITYNFFIERFPIWFSIVFGYTAFWHITLHILNFSSRSFIKNRPYNYEKLFHNMFWSLSGVIIWTFFENIFCYLWATNRLNYINDFTSFNTTSGILKFMIALMGVPLWRSWHFYFAHRLLHFGPLYQQVHSLHHRNTDIEPFSGLCMHPIEHLYYYSCVLPSLFFICSPYAFLWNGVHLLLSPAASHSGWEDHFQSDAFHYLHHRYFECNYAGTDAAFMDIIFGTFRESFNEKFDEKEGPKHRDDAKSTLKILPSSEFIKYLSICLVAFSIWYYFAINVLYNKIILNEFQKLIIASLVGFTPVLAACLFNTGNRYKPINMTMFGNFIHILIGNLFCSVPVTYMCMLALK
jgi:sterol desaturase/sphingolipid hydroxylase (fatty acid hydroxylase superfamily)